MSLRPCSRHVHGGSPDVHPIGQVAVHCESVQHSEPGERAVTEGVPLPPYPRTEELVRAKPPARRATVASLCLAIVVVYGGLIAGLWRELAPHPAVALSPATAYDNQFDFASSVAIADRQWIVQAVAHARPEAVRLIKLIDHRTTVAPLRDGSNLGLTWPERNGRHLIRLDFKRLDGRMRTNRELVLLHELGHVVDYGLLPRSLRDRLAAEVPSSGFCRHNRLGDCAPPEEKFADTFAKWAYRGARSYRRGAGYHLPAPPSLDAWGAPLTRLP